MSKILIVDDNDSQARNVKAALDELWPGTVIVCHGRVKDAYNHLKKILAADHFDVMVLDVGYNADLYGGIRIYNDLINAEVFREKWTHTLIYTKHTLPNIKGATEQSSAFPIRVFVETARIPYDNVIASTRGGRLPLISRIKSLLSQNTVKRCESCGHVDEHG